MQTGKNLVGSNKYQKQSEKSLSLFTQRRQAAGAEPALPIGESLVLFLRTAVTSLTACFGLTVSGIGD